MASDSASRRSPSRQIATILVVLVLPLLLGLYLAPRLVPEPKVGLVRLSYDIFSLTAEEITTQLSYARDNNDIAAVVLVINSPGGSASYSEELYLDVLNTRRQIPVVASVDLLAASGAYYMAVGADEIYAKPTSILGSIGVITPLEGEVFIEDELLTTGPFKAFGTTRDGTIRQVELAKFAFLEAVVAGRGDRLKVGPEVLSRAEVYSGVQAQSMGLVDDLIATDEAIQRAAELAGLRSYEVVELFPLVFPDGGLFDPSPFIEFRPTPIDQARLWARPSLTPGGIYFRYIPNLPDS